MLWRNERQRPTTLVCSMHVETFLKDVFTLRVAVAIAAMMSLFAGCTLFTDTNLSESPFSSFGASCTEDIECFSRNCSAGICLDEEFVAIVPGTFDMGAAASDSFAANGERPRHEVELTRPFAMLRSEVTGALWAEAARTNPTPTTVCFLQCPLGENLQSANGSCCPVGGVNFYDALEFANRLSRERGLDPCYALNGCTGTFAGSCTLGSPPTCQEAALNCDSVEFAGLDCEGYRLPTEAEWEYAVREQGEDDSIVYGSETFIIEPITDISPQLNPIATYRANSNQPTTTSTGSGGFGIASCVDDWNEQQARIDNNGHICAPYAARSREGNSIGLFDMLGNVEEWVWDAGGTYPVAPTTDPLGPGARILNSANRARVVRGCAFNDTSQECRATARSAEPADNRSFARGFRLVRTILP